MSIIDEEERTSKHKKLNNPVSQELRERVQAGAKDFKTQWLKLSQTLYSIWRDKTFLYWGYNRFDDYIAGDAGMKNAAAMKMIKTYAFVEQCESQLLKDEFISGKSAANVPELDAISVLRSARFKEGVSKSDYMELRRMVFDRGMPAAEVRKTLKDILKERLKKNPEDEKEERNVKAVKKFLNEINVFKAEMSVLKMIRPELVKKAEALWKELSDEI